MTTEVILDEYQTTDLTLAAALSESGCRFVDIRVVEERGIKRGIFVFVEVPVELLKAYDNGQLNAEVTSFHAAIKRLSAAAKRKMGPADARYKKVA